MRVKQYVCYDPAAAGDAAFRAIIETTDKSQLQDELNKAATAFVEMVNLKTSLQLLNHLDVFMESIVWRLSKSEDGMYTPGKVKLDPNSDIDAEAEAQPVTDADLQLLKAILRFTTSLLLNAHNKETYGSTELVLALLHAYDDELVMLAMETLTALAYPPSYHKTIETGRHVTALHKNAVLLHPLLDMVEAMAGSHPPVEQMFRSDFVYSSELGRINLMKGKRRFYAADSGADSNDSSVESIAPIEKSTAATATAPSSSSSSSRAKGMTDTASSESEFEIPYEKLSSLSLQELMAEYKPPVEEAERFLWLWQMRSRKWIYTEDGRRKMMMILYSSVAVLLGCYPDPTVLSRFYQDKTELLNEFVYLVRSGPGSSSYDRAAAPLQVPLQVRVMAVQCLCAIVGSRESSSASVLGRFSWLQHDLGITRGQYMGLFPCTLRASLSTFLSLHANGDDLDAAGAGSGSGSAAGTCLSEEQREELYAWLESLLQLAMALINMTSSALSVLTDNGIVQSLLMVVNCTPMPNRSTSHLYLESLIFQLVDACIANNMPTLAVFKELQGPETVVRRMAVELQHLSRIEEGSSIEFTNFSKIKEKDGEEGALGSGEAMEVAGDTSGAGAGALKKPLAVSSSSGSSSSNFDSNLQVANAVAEGAVYRIAEASFARRIVIHQLFNIISSYFHDDRQDGGEHRQVQLIKSAPVALCFSAIFANSHALSSIIIAPALTLFTEIINNDVAPPSLLSHFLACGLAKRALEFVLIAELEFDTETLLSYSSLISAVCLTKDGLELVTKVNPFPSVFGVITERKYYKSSTNLFHGDLPNLLGGNLEEMIRHHPELLPLCLSALMDSINGVIKMADDLAEREASEGINIADDFVPVLHYATTALSCLDTLLLRKQTTVEFLAKGGDLMLMGLHKVALGPSRYFLATLQCAVNPTSFSIGHQGIISAIGRCLTHVWFAVPGELLETLISQCEDAIASFAREMVTAMSQESKPGQPANATDLMTFEKIVSEFLDKISKAPLHFSCQLSKLDDLSMKTARILRQLARVDFLVDTMGTLLRPSSSMPLHARNAACFACLKTEKAELLFQVALKLYTACQLEMCRAKEKSATSQQNERVRYHPVYQLLTIGRESVIVRDSAEDNSRKTCKYERGSVVRAYERVISVNNMVKYRTDDGWVNYYRSTSSLEPQIEVIDVIAKTPEMQEEEKVSLAKEYASWPTLQRFNFEKLASISGSRSGLMMFFHFHISMRHFMSSISRVLIQFDNSNPRQPPGVTVNVPVKSYIPYMLSSLGTLLVDDIQPKRSAAPAATNTTGSKRGKKSTIEKQQMQLASASASASGGNGSPLQVQLENLLQTVLEDDVLKEKDVPGIEKVVIPSMSSYGYGKMCVTIHLAETAYALLFEDKGRGRIEPNHLMITHMFYTNRCLENVIHATSVVVLASFRVSASTPKAATASSSSAAAATSSSSSSVATNDTELDEIFLDRFQPADDEESEANQLVLLTSEEGLPSHIRRARRAVMERKTLALSSLESIFELWKQLLLYCSSAPTQMERTLRNYIDATHEYDPYVLKRSLCIILVRTLVPIWSHPAINTLPAVTVRTVLEQLQLAVKTLLDNRSFPSQSSRSPLDIRPLYSSGTSSLEAGGGVGAGSGRGGFGARGSSVGRPARDVRAEFQPDENVVGALVSMGFSRSSVTQAMTRLNTNSASILTEHLLNNFYDDVPPVRPSNAASSAPAPAPAPSPAPAPAASASASASASGDTATGTEGGQTAAQTTAASAMDVDGTGTAAAATTTTALGSGSSTDDGKGAGGAAASEEVAPAPKVAADDLFPHIGKISQEDQKRDKSIVAAYFKYVYCSVRAVCMNLIESGVGTDEFMWDPVSTILNQSSQCTRESTTLMVLQQMTRTFERHQWPAESSLRIVQLSWFFRRAMELMEAPSASGAGDDAQESLPPLSVLDKLYGVLHSILLLLTGKVYPASDSRAIKSSAELLVLIFTNDERYRHLYGMLTEMLKKALRLYPDEVWSALNAEGKSSVKGNSETASTTSTIANVEKEKEKEKADVRLQWITPALLLLDVVCQPVLVDSHTLTSAINQLSNMSEFRAPISTHSLTAEIMRKGFFDVPMTPQLYSCLNAKYSAQGEKSKDASYKKAFYFKMKGSSSSSSLAGAPDADKQTKAEDTGKERKTLTASSRSSSSRSRKRKSEASEATDSASSAKIQAKGKEEDKEEEAVMKPVDTPLSDDGLSVAEKVALTETILALLAKVNSLDCAATRINIDTANDVLLKGSAARIMTRNQVVQASLQLLIHCTRTEEPRRKFLQLGGTQTVMSVRGTFDGMPAIVFTLLQQQLEETEYLQKSMETTIKLCWMRLSQQKVQVVQLKWMVEVLAPLIYRHQHVFLAALKRVSEITKTSSGALHIEVKSDNNDITKPDDSEGTPRAKANSWGSDNSRKSLGAGEMKAVSSPPPGPALKRIKSLSSTNSAGPAHTLSASPPLSRARTTPSSPTGTGTSGARSSSAKSFSDKKSSRAGGGSSSSVQPVGVPSPMLGIAEELMTLIVNKYTYANAISKQGKWGAAREIDVYPALVKSPPISDLLISLADLVSSVPGMASCVHRFNVLKMRKQVVGVEKAIFHCITGEPLQSAPFVTFLIHCIIVPDILPQSVFDQKAEGSTMTSEAKIERTTGELLKHLMGFHHRTSGAYLFAALVSRSGDGRRRALQELLDTFKIGNSGLDTTARLRAAASIAETVGLMIHPPSEWSYRDTFIVPAREILLALVNMRAYDVLSYALCVVDLTRPHCGRFLAKIAGPIDVLIRKGVPMDAHLKAQQAIADSGEPASRAKDGFKPGSSIPSAATGSASNSTSVTAPAGAVLGTPSQSQSIGGDPAVSALSARRDRHLASQPSGSGNVASVSTSTTSDPALSALSAPATARTGSASGAASSTQTPVAALNSSARAPPSSERMNQTQNTVNPDDLQHLMPSIEERDGSGMNYSSDEGEADNDEDNEEDDDDDDDEDNEDDDDDDGMDDDDDDVVDEEDIISDVDRDDDEDEDEDDDDDDDRRDDDDHDHYYTDDHGHQPHIQMEVIMERNNGPEEDGNGWDDGDGGDDDLEDDLQDDEGMHIDGEGGREGGRDGQNDGDEGEEDHDRDDDDDAVEVEDGNWLLADYPFLDENRGDIVIDRGEDNDGNDHYGDDEDEEGGQLTFEDEDEDDDEEGGGVVWPRDQSAGGISRRDSGGGIRRFTTSGNSIMFGADPEDAIFRQMDEEIARSGGGAVRVQLGGSSGAQMINLLGSLANESMSRRGRASSSRALPPMRMQRSSQSQFMNDSYLMPLRINGSSGARTANTNDFGTSHFSASSLVPTAHPLLTNVEQRRGRNGRGGLVADIFGHFYNSLSSADLGLDNARAHRGTMSPRRKAMGPIVSDRRWGTDIGEIEMTGSRLSILCANVERALADVIDGPPTFSAMKSLSSASASKKGKADKEGRDSTEGSGPTARERANADEDDHEEDEDEDDEDGNAVDRGIMDDINTIRRHTEASMAIDPVEESPNGVDASEPPSATSLPIAPSLQMDELAVPSSSSAPNMSTAPAVQSSTAQPAAPAAETAVSTEQTNAQPARQEAGVTQGSAAAPAMDVAGEVEGSSASTGAGNAHLCPSGMAPEVWAALPLEMQVDVLTSMGRHAEAANILDAEISASDIDREVLLSLPPELRVQVLGEECVERRRRASSLGLDDAPTATTASAGAPVVAPSTVPSIPTTTAPGTAGAGAGAGAGAPVDVSVAPVQGQSTSSSSNSDAPISQVAGSAVSSVTASTNNVAPPSLLSENALFVESLSLELRRDVLISADEDFIRSLPTAMQDEARGLRDQHAMSVNLGPGMGLGSGGGGGQVSGVDMSDAMSMGMRMMAMLQGGGESGPVNISISGPGMGSSSGGGGGSSSADDRTGSSARRTGGESSAMDIDYGMRYVGGSESLGNILGQFDEDEDEDDEEERAGQRRVSTEAAPKNVQPTTVNLREDRADATLPFQRPLLMRLLRCILMPVRMKPARPLMKLLTTCCRYRHCRVWVLQSLMQEMNFDINGACDYLQHIPEGRGVLPDTYSAAAERTSFVNAMSLLSDADHNTCMSRMIATFQYLVRKTDKLVWYDILNSEYLYAESTRMLSKKNDTAPVPVPVPVFSHLLTLLSRHDQMSGVTFDALLALIEMICSQLGSLSTEQVTKLVIQRRIQIASAAEEEAMVSESGADAGNDGSEHKTKKRRLSKDGDAAVIMHAQTTDEKATTSGNTAANEGSEEGKKDDLQNEETEVNKIIPFPVLTDTTGKLLASAVRQHACMSAVRKRLLRVLQPLCQYGPNWHLLLRELCNSAKEVEAEAVASMESLSTLLIDSATKKEEGAEEVLQNPLVSCPTALPEMQLLQLFRVMISLRLLGSELPEEKQLTATFAVSETIGPFMRELDCDALWDCLCNCLDAVRDLEGLADANMDDTFLDDDSTRSPRASFDQTQDDNVQDGAVGGEGDGKVVKALSVLTVRFMPLIECYLSVCGATVLKLPEELRKACQKEQKEQKEKEGGTVQDGDNASSKNSAGEKRKAGHVNADAEETVTTAATEGKSDTGAAADAPALADTPRTRPPTTLLGARFRRHASYWLMQMELEEGPAARRLLRFTQRNRVLLNIILRHNVHLLESTFSPLVSVPRCRHLLHFDVKRAYFKMKLKRMRQNSRSLAGSLRINVRRHCVFEDSFHSLRSKSADDMRRKLSVTFHGEEGMDAGGLTREWYSVLAREIFNANYALFIATSDNVTFQPNSQSYVNPEHLAYFKFVGRVIGKAICDGQLLDAHFTRSFYKHILGQPVNYHDLEAIEPDYYKSLKQILEYPLDLLGVELTFSAESHDFGQHTTVDLIENGRNIAVTDETKSDYVQLIAHHRMTAAIRKQIDAFLEGFHELLPAELISIFDAQELELLISGLPDVDLDDLRAHTEYHGYKATDPVIEHFWSVLRSFSKEEKALFLQFVTGTSKVPLEGFQALIGAEGVKLFNIHKAYGTHLLPTAHTCFNQLDLPEYETEEDLREKILVAIREGSEGFGFA